MKPALASRRSSSTKSSSRYGGWWRRALTILVVEQNTALALEVADHGYVLEQGHFAIQGAAASLAADPRVKQAYLGI